MNAKEKYFNTSKDECDREESLERAENYISDLIDHISELEKDKEDLLQDLEAEHNANRMTEGSFKFPKEHELDCYTCKLIKRIRG